MAPNARCVRNSIREEGNQSSGRSPNTNFEAAKLAKSFGRELILWAQVLPLNA